MAWPTTEAMREFAGKLVRLFGPAERWDRAGNPARAHESAVVRELCRIFSAEVVDVAEVRWLLEVLEAESGNSGTAWIEVLMWVRAWLEARPA